MTVPQMPQKPPASMGSQGTLTEALLPLASSTESQCLLPGKELGHQRDKGSRLDPEGGGCRVTWLQVPELCPTTRECLAACVCHTGCRMAAACGAISCSREWGLLLQGCGGGVRQPPDFSPLLPPSLAHTVSEFPVPSQPRP